MKHRSLSSVRTQAAITLLVLAVGIQGCALDFSGDNFQRLKTFFKLSETLVQGEAALVHSWFFPAAIKIKKRWVRVSGVASAPGGLPADVTVVAAFEDMATGAPQSKVTIKVKIGSDGTFSERKKLKKNVIAESLMMVTVQPAGDDLEKNTELTLCVDLLEKKRDLNKIADCAVGGGNGSPATLTELQNDFFTPTCDSFGCHNADSASAGLVLAAGMSFAELVNEPSSQRSDLDRVEPGDPENSYIVKKLRGDGDINGQRMPEGGPFLSDAELARVSSWISDGAQNN